MIPHTIPRDLRHAIVGNLFDHNKANFEKNKEISDILDGIREKCTKEIYALLGSKAKEYMDFREKSREIAKTMRPLFKAMPEGRKIKNQFQKNRMTESNKFIKNLDINPSDVKSILKNIKRNPYQLLKKIEAKKNYLMKVRFLQM
jgi:Glu-tRNA(Gln) amidotransferase subunit E-like FAD-binding protein